jgi:hypothetical protein
MPGGTTWRHIAAAAAWIGVGGLACANGGAAGGICEAGRSVACDCGCATAVAAADADADADADAAKSIGVPSFEMHTAPDDSMAPNLLAGDKFLLCRNCSIEKGEPVLCDHPDPNLRGVQILGRVVGSEGDKVEIRAGVLRVDDSSEVLATDGKLYQYFVDPDHQVKSHQYAVWNNASLFGHQVPMLYGKDARELLPDHPPEVVGRGRYFLIGDHRLLMLGWAPRGAGAPDGGCNSSFCYGQVPVNSCHGVVVFVFAPFDRGLDGQADARRFTLMP